MVRCCHVISVITFIGFVCPTENFEMDFSGSVVTCRECVEFSKHIDREATLSCSSHLKVCTGNACFMRQCQNCPVYNYVAGCLTLTEWQLYDIADARRTAELETVRAGAILLCENSGNQTTCLCNRKDKCNDLYVRLPYTTYKGNLFQPTVDWDKAVPKIDPVYARKLRMGSYSYPDYFHNSAAKCSSFYTILLTFLILQDLLQ